MLAIFFVENASESGVFDVCLLAKEALAVEVATKLAIGVARATEARNMLSDAAPDRTVLVARLN
jgi:hypothetical protein